MNDKKVIDIDEKEPVERIKIKKSGGKKDRKEIDNFIDKILENMDTDTSNKDK